MERKEAIEVIKKNYPDSSFTMLREALETLIPELKESEDERIRKILYGWVCIEPDDTFKEGFTKEQILAWLEKQGTSYTKRDVDDAYLKGVTDIKNEIEKQYEANYQIRKDIATFIFNYRGDIKDRAKWMDYLGIKVSFVEKQGKQKETLCDKCKKTQPSHSCQDISALGRCALEKQDEQKPKGKSALEATNEEKVDNANKVEPRQEKLTEFEKAVKQVMEEAIECGDTRNLKADADMLLSLAHKSADKVKPRYSTGDVVCDKLCTTLNKDGQPNFKIVDIKDGKYICDNGFGFRILIPISQQDNYELVAKKIEQKSAFDIEIPFGAKDSELIEESYYIPEGFHAEIEGNNVIIKKGEKKPAWSEEDETNLRRTEYAVMKFFGGDCSLVGWLRKSLKERCTWKPSDKQMNTLEHYMHTLVCNEHKEILFGLYSDLKKLKGEEV